MTNMKTIIQGHNKKLLEKDVTHETKSCSCPKTKKDQCPLDSKCLTKCLVYKATVMKSGKFYIGQTESDFKKRYANHRHSFKHYTDKNATSLSQHVWDIGENKNPDIKWEIIKSVKPRKPGSKQCALCDEEKLQILKHSKDTNCLNKRSELTCRCIFYHRSKHKLSNI